MVKIIDERDTQKKKKIKNKTKKTQSNKIKREKSKGVTQSVGKG